ncbi:MAG: hypothetical protein KIT82_15930 [Bradyrhizobium sp.]|nr:hypothetical protein [Bradyrhizobium sp.]
MAKKKTKTKRAKWKAWSKADITELKKHSKAKTPVHMIAKAMKRTEGSLRQRALSLRLGLGHQR